jgi:ribosome-binding factor A
LARKSQSRPVPASQRQLRVAEEIRRTMAEIFSRAHWREPILLNTPITVSGARVSPDLKNATIFCTPLGGVNTEEVIVALNRSKAYLRGELGHAMKLRFVPNIHFAADTSFDEAEHIERLLKTERVARDLKHDEQSSED